MIIRQEEESDRILQHKQNKLALLCEFAEAAFEEACVMTLNNSDFTVMIVTVDSASGSLKAEPKECLTGKGQVLSKGLRA